MAEIEARCKWPLCKRRRFYLQSLLFQRGGGIEVLRRRIGRGLLYFFWGYAIIKQIFLENAQRLAGFYSANIRQGVPSASIIPR